MPSSVLLGRSVGGLSGRKLTFRPQLFWQEVLPEHAVAANLQFECDFESGKNFARQPPSDPDETIPADGTYALSVARCVSDDKVPSPADAALATRALRIPPPPVGSGSAEEPQSVATMSLSLANRMLCQPINIPANLHAQLGCITQASHTSAAS